MLFALGVLVIPSITLAVVEGSWRRRWRLDSHREEDLGVVGVGTFREGNVRTRVAVPRRSRAPWGLRAMAFSCWFLAQMVIPGALVFALGVLVAVDAPRHLDARGDPAVYGLMASFIPGAWCAWRLWSAGCALLRGERDRADRATSRAAKGIVVYNVLAIALAAGWALSHRRDEFLWASVVYCGVSLVHALALRATFVRHRDEYPTADALRG